MPDPGFIITYPPDKPAGDRTTVFLAGSIDNGRAEEWQSIVEQGLSDLKVEILNPRRKDWNPDLKPELSTPEFAEQVAWEHDGLMNADLILFYFVPGSVSPVTLMELGLMASPNAIVCCPEGYWRRGNVEFIAREYKTGWAQDLDDLIAQARTWLEARVAAQDGV